jgi:hypothetical protein
VPGTDQPADEVAAFLRIRRRHPGWQLAWRERYWTAERRSTETAIRFIVGHSLTELARRLDDAEPLSPEGHQP